MKILFLLFALFINLFSQTTEVIKKTDIYSSPNKSKDNIVGEILT